MKQRMLLIVALLLLLLLTACDKNAINQLARQERDKIEVQIQKLLGADYEIEEFVIRDEGFEDNKSKYVMNCVVKLNKKPLGVMPQEIPWRLEFAKKNGKWNCSKSSINLLDVGNFFTQNEPPSGPNAPPSGELTPADVLAGLQGLIGGVDQTLLNMTALSTEEENQVGAELQQQILADLGISRGGKFDVQGIFNKIKARSSRGDLAWDCTVTADTQFNAFAVAGGKTFLNLGMLSGLNSEAELAFVIAHEIAHNDLKHCVQSIQHAVRASQVDPLLGEVVGVAYSIYKYPFSQEMEYAADKRGVELMTAAGWSKQGALSFFRKLQQYEPTAEDPNLQAVNDFISTHPTAQKRIERIEKM